MSRIRSLLMLSVFCVSFNLDAANVTQINRYGTVENKPSAAQLNPLLAVQQVHFPQTVITIAQALEYWLQYSGFHLAPADKRSQELQLTLSLPLPQVVRHLGPLTVKEGLETLVGQNVFTLITNPLLREINFRLNQNLKINLSHTQGRKA